MINFTEKEIFTGATVILSSIAYILNKIGVISISFGKQTGNGKAKCDNCPVMDDVLKEVLSHISVPLSSEATGGNRFISEEALSKFKALENCMKEKYVTKEKHQDLCKISSLEMQTFVKKTIYDGLGKIQANLDKKMTGNATDILEAIKNLKK